MRKPKYWNIVKLLQEKFQGDCEHFVVTGGIALSLNGLVEHDDVGDVDILLINANTEAIKNLQFLQSLSPVPDRSNYKMLPGDKFVQFILQGVKVDVWLSNDVRPTLWYDYVQVSNLMDILDAKKSYGRPKDFKFINNLAVKILNMAPSVRVETDFTNERKFDVCKVFKVNDNGHNVDIESISESVNPTLKPVESKLEHDIRVQREMKR